MTFNHVEFVTVNIGDWYHVLIHCDKIALAQSENPIHSEYLTFYRNGAIVARIPADYVVSFYYHRGILSPEVVTVMKAAFKNVL